MIFLRPCRHHRETMFYRNVPMTIFHARKKKRMEKVPEKLLLLPCKKWKLRWVGSFEFFFVFAQKWLTLWILNENTGLNIARGRITWNSFSFSSTSYLHVPVPVPSSSQRLRALFARSTTANVHFSVTMSVYTVKVSRFVSRCLLTFHFLSSIHFNWTHLIIHWCPAIIEDFTKKISII